MKNAITTPLSTRAWPGWPFRHLAAEHGPSRPEERVKCTTHSPCHALLLTASPASGTRRAAPYPLAVRTDTDLLVASASPCRPSLGYVSCEQTMTERACVVPERAPSLEPAKGEGRAPACSRGLARSAALQDRNQSGPPARRRRFASPLPQQVDLPVSPSVSRRGACYPRARACTRGHDERGQPHA